MARLRPHQGRSQGEGGRGTMNRRLSGFYGIRWLKKHCSLYQKCSVGLKYAINALAAAFVAKETLFSLPEVFCGPQICNKCVGGGIWLRPGPRWGSSRRSPRPPSRWGRGHTLPNPYLPRRLRRSASVPSRIRKILATPLSHTTN